MCGVSLGAVSPVLYKSRWCKLAPCSLRRPILQIAVVLRPCLHPGGDGGGRTRVGRDAAARHAAAEPDQHRLPINVQVRAGSTDLSDGLEIVVSLGLVAPAVA